MKKEDLLLLVENCTSAELADYLISTPAQELEGLGAAAAKLVKSKRRAEIALAYCGNVPQLKLIDWEGMMADTGWRGDIRAVPEKREFHFGEVFGNEHSASVFRALGARSLEFTSEWAQWLSEQGASWHYKYFQEGRWIGLLKLAAVGFCRWPNSDIQALDMVYYCHRNWWKQPGSEVANFLRPHLALLEPDIWRLFTLETVLGCSWSSLDEGFADALILLQAEAALSRERMIEASLDAISRDFKLVVARHHRKLHNKLALTPAEMAPHAQRYLSALSSSDSETQKWAAEQVSVLFAVGHLSGEAVLDNLRTLLSQGAKPAVAQAIKLMKSVVSTSPDLAPHASQLACEAMLVDDQPVQELAMGFIAKYGKLNDEALRTRLAESEFTIHAAIKQRFSTWFEKQPLSLETTISPPGMAPEMYVVLDPAHRIPPIADFCELLDTASLLIERPERVDELERFLDGLTRLGASMPADIASLTEPLISRLDKIRAQQGRRNVAVHRILAAWLGEEELSALRLGWGHQADAGVFVTHRFNEVAALHKDRSQLPLLAAPTHRGFWIEPAVLVESASLWIQEGREPGRADMIQALMRLSFEKRPEALAAAMDLPGELGRVIRYALGGEETVSNPKTSFWVAAEAARDPMRMRRDRASAEAPDWELLSTNLLSETCRISSGAEAAWQQSLWPQNLELYAAGWGSTHFDRPLSEYGHILCAPILEGNLPLGPRSSELVCELFSHIYKEGPALGAEIVIRTVDDGRFAESSVVHCFGVAAGDDQLAWAQLPIALGEIIKVSAAHAEAVRQILESILANIKTGHGMGTRYELPALKSRNQVAKLLTLLEECYAITGRRLEEPELIANLKKIASSGKSAAVLKRLLN